MHVIARCKLTSAARAAIHVRALTARSGCDGVFVRALKRFEPAVGRGANACISIISISLHVCMSGAIIKSLALKSIHVHDIVSIIIILNIMHGIAHAF